MHAIERISLLERGQSLIRDEEAVVAGEEICKDQDVVAGWSSRGLLEGFYALGGETCALSDFSNGKLQLRPTAVEFLSEFFEIDWHGSIVAGDW